MTHSVDRRFAMTDNSQKTNSEAGFAPVNVTIEQNVLNAARVALWIAMGAFIALVIVSVIPTVMSAILRFEIPVGIGSISKDATFAEKFFAYYTIHLLLTIIIIVSLIAGHRLVSASGANSDIVIPPQDYALLAPLVANSKSDAVDIYVKLSSLRGVTGFFTKLGLTGLPLATISLTLIFSILALAPGQQTNFLDLAKLTLGAFIGSFVQRQVEKRAEQSPETKITSAGK